MNPIIEVTNVTKSYGKIQALNGISFSIGQGECYGLLGPNGAGKSTTINLLSTLFPPDTGEIRVSGMDVRKSVTAVKEILGIVPQEIALYENLTAWDNMLFWGSIYGVKGKELHAHAADLLHWVGLSDRKNDKVQAFSGGMKRRLNLASTLLHSPRILLLDEPTVGVDPQSRNHIFELIQQLNRDGITIIYTTHYMEEAEKLCNRIGIIDMGRIVAQGTLDELKKISNISDVIVIRCDRAPSQEVLETKLKTQVSVTDHTVQIVADDARKDLTRYVVACSEAGYEINHIDVQTANLETVFLKMTGKQLRD